MTQPNEEYQPLDTQLVLAGLATRVGELVNASHDIKRAAQVSKGMRVLIGITLFSLLAIAGIGTYFSIVVRQNQKSGRAVVDTIKDCTDPEGQCFHDAQARTATAVAGINKKTQQIVVAAAACARVPENDTEAEIRVCVEARIK